MKKILSMVLCAAMMVALLAGCSSGSSPSTQTAAATPAVSSTTETASKTDTRTVTIAQSADPQTVDPHKVGGDIAANVWRNICEPLFFYDENWQTYCLLAESYKQNSDTQWTITLRKGIQFSNGEPFNAEAVIWNVKRAASEEFPRQSFEYKKYLADVTAIDEMTVQFDLSQPDIFFIQHMAEVPMLAPAYSEKIGEDAIGTDPIGTGPYKFVSWEPDNQIVLEKNENYWGTPVDFDRVVFRTIPDATTRIAEMVNGTVDIISSISYESIAQLESNPNISVTPKKLNRIEYVGFNTLDWCETPALKNTLVRQAINYAVDTDAIIEYTMGGFGEKVSTLWRSDYAEFDAELNAHYTYDPEKAKALLAEAGYPNGFELKLMTDTDNHAKAQEVTEAVASYLEAVGIKTTVSVLDDTAAYAIIVNGQDAKQCPGMFDWNWGGKPGLYESTLTGVLASTGMSSYNAIKGYDELVNQILSKSTAEERAPYIKQIQQLMIDDPMALYLFRLYDIYAVNSRVNWSPIEHYAMLVREMKAA